MILELALIVLAYVVGAVPFAYIFVRGATGRDVRLEGSGNVGGTNALRSAGWKVGVAVTLLDIGKGALAVWAMLVFNPESAWLAGAMLAVVVGHCFPVFLKFRGGKGVAAGLGAFLVIAPSSALAAIAVWVVVLVASRWVSLASMVATASFPVLVRLIDHPDRITLAAVAVAAILIILRHHSNIRNLIAGTEPRLGPGFWR
ncbi:MAG TPA: glycerol-3-phosphate 1-O-acyltransferase PlsY [Candidatus Sulfomarinibacteraceae bacterium]|nr:glycerol-3-phosphate 1-O-acyltransferase PlsY [Candidatus Sulfomarinibacteraceae bacterium]